MNHLKRGMVIDVNLEPTQGSETGKIRPCIIVTNIEISSSSANNLTKKSMFLQ